MAGKKLTQLAVSVQFVTVLDNLAAYSASRSTFSKAEVSEVDFVRVAKLFS